MAVIRDITEDFNYDLSIPEDAIQSYELNSEAYDIALNDQPFIIGPSEERPYRRETAEYRRQQVDQTTEPGEQSLTGWWFRSQSSFHLGSGAKFYEPSQDENLRFRFQDSEGADIWTRGQVTLLKDTVRILSTANEVEIVSANDGTNDCIIVADGAELKKIIVSGDTPTVSTYTLGDGHTDEIFYSLTTDGSRYFAADAVAIHRGNIGGTTSDATTYATGTDKVVINFVKQRLFAGVDNKLYELNSNISPLGSHATTALPTAHYIHPNSAWQWTSIAESGSGIYASGYAGSTSAIYKVTVKEDATLAAAIVTAELPIGERVLSLYSYLGYMMIGTSKGARAAVIDADTGNLSYGPLIFESPLGVNSFFASDRFVWCASNVNGKTGLIRIDLSEATSTLRFAYANDIYVDENNLTQAVSFLGNRPVFSADGDGVYIQSESELVQNGYLKTGFIRYATLESKFFKFIKLRGNLQNGTITVATISEKEVFDTLLDFTGALVDTDIGIARPQGAQEFVAFQFTLNRDSGDNTKAAIMTGYQIKALPAIEKQRLIQYPLFCYDVEMDKYNVQTGYDNRAYDRILKLEELEKTGDVVSVRDFRTGEAFSGLIEDVKFFSQAAPDARFSGFGGVLLITIRKF